MENWLSCTVSPGQFSAEYSVSGERHDGTRFSLFAPREFVECDPEPTDDVPSEGWLRAEECSRRGDLVLLRLPAQILENGYFVTVRSDQLRNARPAGSRVGT